MRFPEAKIKDAILHAAPEFRDRAARYFAESYSQDVSVTAQVIKAVETYGRQDACRLISSLVGLPQTEASVAWVVGELNDDRSDGYENYTSDLSKVLVEADPALLVSHESAIREARHFRADLLPALAERLAMHSWDEATCWRELEAFCEAGKNEQDVDEVDPDRAYRIVDALARYGERCEAKVFEVLDQKVRNDAQSPACWMELLAVRLAGRARLVSTIPLLIGKLVEDVDDFLNEKCAEALTRIGSPAVVQAVAEAFPGAGRDFQIYAVEPLEHIHSDLAVATCLDLLGREPDADVQDILAEALLSQFALEGVEAARRLLLGRKLDFKSRGLRNLLLATCAFMGERFPEYDEWSAIKKAEREEHERRVKELEGDPAGLLLFALEKLTGVKVPDLPKPRPHPVLPSTSRPIQPSLPAVRRSVGRNEPCPCGSGKKFKKCCGLHPS